MKLCIVIQSDAFRTSAGMRIRYDRFRDSLADPEVSLDSHTVAELAAAPSLDHDVYIFCKTFTIEALILARRVRAEGKVVGQDLFDDYFSQFADSRLERFRDWLRDMAPVTQFALCSTPRMVEVLRRYMPGIRIVAIDDPVIGFDPPGVAASADAKIAGARDSGTLDVAWFGIGDNPYFPVGLADLGKCDAILARIEQLGLKVRLRIVTNRRAFEKGGGELLRPLSVATEIIEWTEESEQEILSRSAVAILPVNGQSFSAAKSTNRAVTALSNGCQVLSVGFPLYRRLEQFIYRSADKLVADIRANSCALSSAHIDNLAAELAALADPVEAAAQFVGEARMAVVAAAKEAVGPATLCLIHGRKSTIALHKLVSSVRGLSVATPFTKSAWNFHVRFDVVGRHLVMRVTVALAERLALSVRQGAEPLRILDFDFVELDFDALGVVPFVMFLEEGASPIEELAVYEDVMRFAESCCRAAFAPADVLFSDLSPIVRRPRNSVEWIEEGPLEPPEETAAAESTLPAGARPTSTSPRRTTPRPNLALQISGASRRRRRQIELIERSDLFDCDWYLSTYPDVAAARLNPAAHYLDFGWREGRDPGPHFSSKLYLKKYRDVSAQDTNPLLHYLQYGRAEGRRIAASLSLALAAPAECD